MEDRMRASAMTALALAAVLATGCGGIASSCARVAVKGGTVAGTGTAAKTGAGIAGSEAFEQAARSASQLGRGAAEAEGARLGAAQPGRAGIAAREQTEQALSRGASEAEGDPSSIFLKLGKEGLQQGADKLP